MEDLELLKHSIAGLLKSRKLEIFEDTVLPRISSSNVSQVAIQLYTTYRLLRSGKKDLVLRMFPEGAKVDLLAWYEGRKVPAFAIVISKEADEDIARRMENLASYYKLLVHLEEAGPRRVGNVIMLSYRDLEEHIGIMLSAFLRKPEGR